MSVFALGRSWAGAVSGDVRADVRGNAITVALAGAWAGLFAALALARHDAFWTARFDLGNMVQAVWSTLQGRPLETTDVAGEQVSRFAAHADPLVLVYAPVYAAWPDPRSLLVAQAAFVAAGALPAYWLGRRWIGEGSVALVAPLAYLLYPPLQWAVLTDVHAVTLAAPLLVFSVWAADADRPVLLVGFSLLAVLSKEQVGLAIVGLGIWIAVRYRRRALGAALALGALTWTALAVSVIVPGAGAADESPFVGRYSELGDSPGQVLLTLVSRPWDATVIAVEHGAGGYLASLLLPLLLLPLAAPLLAAVALPEIAINLLSDWPPQRSIEFHYGAVVAPFLVAAAVLGLGRGAHGELPGPLRRLAGRGRQLALALVAAGLAATLLVGPLPVDSPLGSDSRRAEYAAGAHADALRAATAAVPDDVPVSAGNYLGARLSARQRVLTFPVIREAEWVIVDQERPYMADRLDPVGHARAVDRLRADPGFRVVFQRDGVLVFARASGERTDSARSRAGAA